MLLCFLVVAGVLGVAGFSPILYCYVPDAGCGSIANPSQCSANFPGCRSDSNGGCELRPECSGKLYACLWKSLTLAAAQTLVPQCDSKTGTQSECSSQRETLAQELGIQSFCQQAFESPPTTASVPPVPRFPTEYYALTFYVHAVLGQDSPLISGGARTVPFQTLAYAVERSRQFPSSFKRRIVLLGGGVYRLSATLQLTETDSNLTIEGEAGFPAVVSGSLALLPHQLSWQPHNGNIQVAQLSDVVARQLGSLSALFVNGKPMTRARFPNSGYQTTGLSKWTSPPRKFPVFNRQQIPITPGFYGTYYSAQGGACTNQFTPSAGYFCEPNNEAQGGCAYAIPTSVVLGSGVAQKLGAASWAGQTALPPVFLNVFHPDKWAMWTFQLSANESTPAPSTGPSKPMNLADLLAWQQFYLASGGGRTWLACGQADMYFNPCNPGCQASPTQFVQCALQNDKLVLVRVVLRGNGLVGTVSDALNFLTSLEQLDLSNNPQLGSAGCSAVCALLSPQASCNLSNTKITRCTPGPSVRPTLLPTSAKPTPTPTTTGPSPPPTASQSPTTPQPSPAPGTEPPTFEYEYEYAVPRTHAPTPNLQLDRFPTSLPTPAPTVSIQSQYCASRMVVRLFTTASAVPDLLDESWSADSQASLSCWMLLPTSRNVLSISFSKVELNGDALRVYTLQQQNQGVVVALEQPVVGNWTFASDRTLMVVLSRPNATGALSGGAFTAAVSTANADCLHGRETTPIWTGTGPLLVQRLGAIEPLASFCFQVPLASSLVGGSVAVTVPANYSLVVKNSDTGAVVWVGGDKFTIQTPSALLFVYRSKAQADGFSAQFAYVPRTSSPSLMPTKQPTKRPTRQPTLMPTKQPTLMPTKRPTTLPTTMRPTLLPTVPLANTTRRRRLAVGDATLTLFKGGFQDARGDCGKGGSSLWFVENALALLDVPGEYFLNGNLLYFYPPDGVDLSTAQVELTLAGTRVLINALGNAQAAVSQLRLRNLQFQHTYATHMDPHEIPSGGDWSLTRQAAVVLEYAQQCEIAHNRFLFLGGHGVLVSNSGSQITIASNVFDQLGASAVLLVGDPLFSHPDAYDRVRHNESHVEQVAVTGNQMSNLGLFVKQSSGVFLSLAKSITVRRNVIYNCPRAGITFNDGFGGNTTVRENVLFNLVTETEDHGPFNVWDRQQWVEPLGKLPFDIASNLMYGNAMGSKGIDLDDGARNYRILNNVVFAGLLKFKGSNVFAQGNVVFPIDYACYLMTALNDPVGGNGQLVLRDGTCISHFTNQPAYFFNVADAEAKRLCQPNNFFAAGNNQYLGVASKWAGCGRSGGVTFASWQSVYGQDKANATFVPGAVPSLEAEYRLLMGKFAWWWV